MQTTHQKEKIDVLIVTAAKGEDKAVKSVFGESWQRVDPTPQLELYWDKITLTSKKGRPFTVGLVHSGMGTENAGTITTIMLQLQPNYVMMCGICAGHPDETKLGDVIIADKVFRYDTKSVKRLNDGSVEEKYDISTYGIAKSWWQLADRLEIEGINIHIGPIATGEVLQKEPEVWDTIQKYQRKCIGLEMEASVIGHIGQIKELRWMVIKGVLDNANPGKNDEYRVQGTKNAAIVLKEFLEDVADQLSKSEERLTDGIELLATYKANVATTETEIPVTKAKQPSSEVKNRTVISENVEKKFKEQKLQEEERLKCIKYQEAVSAMKSATTKEDFIKMSQAFNYLLGYKDADDLAAICINMANAIAEKRNFKLEIGEIINFGGYSWRVLDIQNNRALFLSERIIDNREYNKEFEGVTWETCTLRKYLNKEFYNNFSPEERSRIVEKEIHNNKNPWYDTSGGNVTRDRIFLLSIEEVVKYFGDSGDLKNRKGWYWQNSKFELRDGKGYFINDIYNTERKALNKENVSSWWWLRSPGLDSNDAAYVNNDGSVGIYGDYVYINGGVRPALWLNL